MKHYLWLISSMMILFTLGFVIVEQLGFPLLTDPTPWLSHAGWGAALLGIGLLIADILIPVPATIVMIANGALFGLALGTLLSMIGSLGAALFGFWVGRRGGPLLERLIPEEERNRVNRLLERWGPLAVVVTRPVPILAESVVILAGASPMSWSRLTMATLAGALPASLLYALTGATAANLDNMALIFSLVLLISGVFWFLGKRASANEPVSDQPLFRDDLMDDAHG